MRRPMVVGIAKAGAAITLALAALSVAFLGAFVYDPSPLARMPKPLMVRRDLAYGEGPWRRLDLVHDPASVRPLVLLVHPGGWMTGDKSAWHGWMADLAGRGFAAASVNFRPSTEAPFPAAAEDVRDALRWLRARSGDLRLDPDRIAVMGYSSGAHLAAWVSWTGEAGIRGTVAVSGVYDLLMEERGVFPNQGDDPVVVRFLGGRPSEVPDLAKRASPLSHLDAGDPPMLVLHGALDRRIDAEQARRLGRRLADLGRKDEVRILPGEGHGRALVPGSEEERVRSFLEVRLKK